MFPKLFFILKLFGFTFSLIGQRLSLVISGKLHRLTYTASSNPKNVVVIGGSFAGYFLAQRLAGSLPSGYRVILVERHSHFHFTWNFPRSTVIHGQEQKAFIPYPAKPRNSPEGSYEFKQGSAVAIEDDKVRLENGEVIGYEYLALATGSQKRYPPTLEANEKGECTEFFAQQQERIKTAKSIIIVGGGAAGVEVAGDIKSRYPEKNVTLVHSREHLLNSFGEKLHVRAKTALEELGVELYLGERVVTGLDLEGPGKVALRGGKVLQCDFLIKCTGQVPDSHLLRSFSPSSIAPSGAILVEKTLQIRNAPSPRIFALGDVIDIPGPKQGRPATMQGFLVAENIVRNIQGKPMVEYTPSILDRSIELTLGLGKNVMYISDGTNQMAFTKKMKDESMHAAQAWRFMDAKPFHDPQPLEAKLQA
ncbi:hypothetical protein H2200_002571 [Cladophialophora chaetospira]|uniref:FAD/NAD(P)-binding domain-containing protein n=1 Tax=Cladophialophora chaetospira TaxID=386627 RepID=A0AA39CNP4_9EURO|nr:hypothetical protein H2200_002571 [Cladophialophora chaetospira]